MKKFLSTLLTGVVLGTFAFMAIGSSSSKEFQGNGSVKSSSDDAMIYECNIPAIFEYDSVTYGVDVDYWNSVPSGGMATDGLQKGYQYMAVGVLCENKGTKDTHLSSGDFKCYADNVACEETFVILDGVESSVDVSSGRQGKCYAFFIVPKDAETIELEFEPDIFSHDKCIIHCK